MVTRVDDIVEELSPVGRCVKLPRQDSTSSKTAVIPPAKTAARIQKVPEMAFSMEEAAIIRGVPEGGTTIDVLARTTGYAASRVNALLVGLRLKGRIRFLPGNRVSLAKKI